MLRPTCTLRVRHLLCVDLRESEMLMHICGAPDKIYCDQCCIAKKDVVFVHHIDPLAMEIVDETGHIGTDGVCDA